MMMMIMMMMINDGDVDKNTKVNKQLTFWQCSFQILNRVVNSTHFNAIHSNNFVSNNDT